MVAVQPHGNLSVCRTRTPRPTQPKALAATLTRWGKEWGSREGASVPCGPPEWCRAGARANAEVQEHIGIVGVPWTRRGDRALSGHGSSGKGVWVQLDWQCLSVKEVLAFGCSVVSAGKAERCAELPTIAPRGMTL